MSAKKLTDQGTSLPDHLKGLNIRTTEVQVLDLVVTYDTLVSHDDLSDLLEKARELGGVVRADLYTLRPGKTSLI